MQAAKAKTTMTKPVFIDKCVFCGKPEVDHCVFEAIKAPGSCVCAGGEWSDPANIPEVCENHVGDKDRNCVKCEHDYRCHV